MRIPVCALVAVVFAATAWPQPNAKPDVDWASIEKQVEALRVAVQARDLKKAQDVSQRLWGFTTEQWVKQSPTAAERLAEAELRLRPGDTTSLPYLASLAAQAGDYSKAESYARQALTAPSAAYDSVHAGNIVLGIVALERDHDVATAKHYLAAAGRTKGSMLLDRWGPNLALAKALLGRGEKEAVLDYFQAAKTFVTKNPKLDEWIATLKGGGTPDLSHEYLWHF